MTEPEYPKPSDRDKEPEERDAAKEVLLPLPVLLGMLFFLLLLIALILLLAYLHKF